MPLIFHQIIDIDLNVKTGYKFAYLINVGQTLGISFTYFSNLLVRISNLHFIQVQVYYEMYFSEPQKKNTAFELTYIWEFNVTYIRQTNTCKY